MRAIRACALLLAAGAAIHLLADRSTTAAPASEPMIGHMVYFTLNDSTPAKVQALVDACNKYLSKHPGEVFYAAGPRGKSFARDVNVQDWDVGLHLVFKSKADYDKYATAPRHLQFIEENKATWKQVRVFDTEVSGTR